MNDFPDFPELDLNHMHSAVTWMIPIYISIVNHNGLAMICLDRYSSSHDGFPDGVEFPLRDTASPSAEKVHDCDLFGVCEATAQQGEDTDSRG